MGGESTSRNRVDKARGANSAAPQLEVQECLCDLTVKARFAGLFVDGCAMGSRVVDASGRKTPLFAGKLGVGPARRRQAGVADPLRWSSCSETTGGPATRLAAIARAAAIPPETVVMQGTPRPTAARRIS